jgi:hypothetical protein
MVDLLMDWPFNTFWILTRVIEPPHLSNFVNGNDVSKILSTVNNEK